jgi:hypothetical protein
VSHVSIAQPLSTSRETARSLALVELWFAVEVEVAQRLLPNGSIPGAASPDCAKERAANSSIIVRLNIAPAVSASRVHIALRLGEREIDLGGSDVDVTLTHGPRMAHVDAHARGAAPPLLSISIELGSGRVVFARSNIPFGLGLPGGTYNPPQVIIEWE